MRPGIYVKSPTKEPQSQASPSQLLSHKGQVFCWSSAWSAWDEDHLIDAMDHIQGSIWEGHSPHFNPSKLNIAHYRHTPPPKCLPT